MEQVAATLTMQDIADLAHVRRPTVSMWRKRPRARGEVLPFPEPVTIIDGTEHFGRDEVVAWLDETGRGNNPEARLDALGVSVPTDADLETLVVLLCVHAATGEQLDGLSYGQLTDLARDADPSDQYVLSEVMDADPPPSAGRFIDELVEASFGLEDALARLENGRLKRESADRGLAGEAIEMVRAVAGACHVYLGQDETVLVHGGDRNLSLALAADFGILVVPDDSPQDRAVRRRAAIAGISTTSAAGGAGGLSERLQPGVRVASVLGLDVDMALDRIDDVVVDLGPQDVAVILGFGSVLCDRLRGERERLRAETLRAGRLMMAARLPRGLWRAAHRQSLGLWVLHGGKSTQRPRMADLATGLEEDIDLEDLTSDVVGALESTDDRAFRYCRLGDLVSVLAGGPVVPRGVRAVRMGEGDATSHLERIHAATLTTSTPLTGYDVLVEQAPGAILLRHRSLGELRETGHVTLKRGSRIDAGLADPAGTVAVASADGSWDGVRLDPFDATERYPRTVRSERGDIVFLDSPWPVARVETEVGALVASPSRILRLNETAEIGPHALAAIINEIVPVGSEWETWSVPVLSRSDAKLLDDTLRDSEHYRAELRRRVDATHELTRALIEGVAAGAVTLDTAPTTTGITANQRKEG